MTASVTTGGRPSVVYFTTSAGESGFAIRRADGQYWAANQFRGYRLCGLDCKRVRPQLVAGDLRIPVWIVGPPDVAA